MQLKRNKEMKFKTLRKSYKKEIVVGALAVCVIGGALTFNLTRAKYKLTQDIPLVRGTINYKAYDFKIMAMYQSEDGNNYTEVTDRMPASGYVINEEKSYCTLDNKNKDTRAILKTIDGHHVMENLAPTDKCYLYFDRKTSVDNADDLLAKLKNEAKTTTPDFSQVAATDEGVYSVSDGMYGGTSYYWRGAVTNNYVKFGGFCWRIVRINGDGSIRLIYDGTTCHTNGTSTVESIAKTNIAYSSSKRSEYVGWTYTEGSQRGTSVSSNAKVQTESWYTSSITGTNVDKVAEGKFCNDRNVATGNWSSSSLPSMDYAPNKRASNNDPTLNCDNSGDIYNVKVGAITLDEMIYAGGKLNTNNQLYYLYNGKDYWGMSPSAWRSPALAIFGVNSIGCINDIGSVASYGIRPVINLRSDISFSSGDGTLNNPYVVTD